MCQRYDKCVAGPVYSINYYNILLSNARLYLIKYEYSYANT